jgi:hypothetical protein
VLQRNVDAIVSVVLTVALVLVAPVGRLSGLARLGVFAVIVTGVPALVCAGAALLDRLRAPSRGRDAPSSVQDDRV